MIVFFNNNQYDVNENITLNEAVLNFNLPNIGVAIAVNNNVIPRNK